MFPALKGGVCEVYEYNLAHDCFAKLRKCLPLLCFEILSLQFLVPELQIEHALLILALVVDKLAQQILHGPQVLSVGFSLLKALSAVSIEFLGGFIHLGKAAD